MAELLVVRHGQASFGADNYDQLSELGYAQAEATGAFLRTTGWVPDRAITGTMVRQKQTLDGMGFDLPGEEHAGFNEYNFTALLNARFGGAAPEAVHADKKTHFRTLRDTILEWQRNGIENPPESWLEFTSRVANARDYATQSGPKRVLVVSSGGVIGQLVASCLGAPEPMMMELNLQIKNASLHRFVFSKGRMMLTEFNASPQFDTDPNLLSYS